MIVYLFQVTGIVAALRWSSVRTDDERTVCLISVLLGIAVSLVFPEAW